MNLNTIYESDIEEVSLDWLTDLGYTVLHGPDIAPDMPNAERSNYKEVVLTRRLQDAVTRLNPKYPPMHKKKRSAKCLIQIPSHWFRTTEHFIRCWLTV